MLVPCTLPQSCLVGRDGPGEIQSAVVKAKIEKHAQAILAFVYEAGLGMINVDKIEADREIA